MRSKFLILFLSFFLTPCSAEEDIKKNCSEGSEVFVEAAWYAYPRNTAKREGDPNVSITLLEQALRSSPKCQWALRHISGLYDELGNDKLAKKYNDKLLSLYPNDLTAKSTKSDLLVHEGKIAEAIQILEEIIKEHGPGDGYWHYALAKIYAYEDNASKALDYLEIAAKIDKGWLDQNNAQASQTFAAVIKHERFKRLLQE